MVSSSALTIAMLLVSQTGDELRLRRGEEFVYRGTYVETATNGGTEFQRSFELENRVFVSANDGQRFELAVVSSLSSPTSTTPPAVRFALLTAERSGRVRLKTGGPLPYVADGPPSLDCAAMIERPTDGAPTWTIADVQPPFEWRRLAFETRHNVRCLQLTGVQQSESWERVTADRPAWRRQETAWVSSLTGIVERLERVSEWRRIGERDSVVRATTTYELHGGVSVYPDALGNDRRNEIRLADLFQQELRKLRAERASPERFDRLISRIDSALRKAPATPFRPVILSLRRQAESARRGEPPAPDAP